MTKTLKKKLPAKKAVAKKAPAKKTAKISSLSYEQALKKPDDVFREIGRMNNLMCQKVFTLSMGRALLAKILKKSLKAPATYTLAAAPFNKKALTEVLNDCELLAKLEKSKTKLTVGQVTDFNAALNKIISSMAGAFVDGAIFYDTLEALVKTPGNITKSAMAELKKSCEYYCTLEILAHHWTHFMVDAEDLDRFKA